MAILQKKNLSAICNCLWVRAKFSTEPALAIVPAACDPILAFGLLNCGVLVRLKNSARNCRYRLWSPPHAAFLNNEKSSCLVSGPMRIFFPAFPNVNWAGVEKQLTLNHCCGPRSAGVCFALQPVTTFAR